ncbi:hypothetical protein [Bradyrhizobium japonicum]|uniref:hypothetical protein n=1 Tax=Bradyrhizobium japonicum TaxID=375 RepID=UPI00271555AD|nr:hypothetical protein [Bradyrhizobium japonicum]WLB24142.1 hypothetical protein QIH95_50440 [Bradyrhizobium japonicum]
MSTPFDPSALDLCDLARRLKVESASALPAGWRAGRFPGPAALPIDECVRDLLKRRRIRQPAELQAIHRLGVCPYAIARYGILRAASFARQEAEKQKSKPAVIAALKGLKQELPRLCISLDCSIRLVQPLIDASGQLELSAVHPEALSNAILSLRNQLGRADVPAVLGELSKYRGNVWRHNFVTALFAEWWVLTCKDPKPSAGPSQEFISAAWCSLSPLATTMDADWASAIKVALSRCKPGAWRTNRRS